ncbi:MAG: PAS domain S-box protein, partial [Pseudomonadota bacterium]
FGLMLAVINTRVNAARIAEELTDKIKRREALLQESEAFKLAILNAVPAEIAVVDRDGVILAVNDPWRRFALENGIEPGKPAPHTEVGDNYLAACQLETSFAADDGAANISEGIRAVLEDGLPSFSLEYPCHSTTQKFWFTMTVTPMGCDAGGKVVITHTDISGRKLLEEAREEALGRLQKIASSVPGVVYQFRLRPDGSACFPFASEAIREIYRVSPEEVREDASKVFAILHPDDFDGVVAYIRQSAQDLTPWRHEYRVKFDDGTVHWLSGNALPEREADGATLWHGFITDITGRKQAEAIFHAVFDQSSFLAGILDRQGRLVEVNSTALSFTDTPREAVIGQYFPDTPWWDNGEDRDKLIEVLNLAYTGTAASFEATHAVPAGGRINVMFSTMPIIMENGIHLAVFGMDVTQRKQAEDQLHLAASVFTHAWEGIMITAADGTIIDVNDAFSDITGYSREEALGRNPRMLNSGLQGKAFYTDMWRDLVGKGHWYGEIWNRHKNGRVYAEMLSISAVPDA